MNRELRPSAVSARLLRAMDASEGRRRRRKRDTTPDAIGLELKREFLTEAVREDPAPEAFERWLLTRCSGHPAPGAALAMARSILEEWQLALASPAFRDWLEAGAPSEDG